MRSEQSSGGRGVPCPKPENNVSPSSTNMDTLGLCRGGSTPRSDGPSRPNRGAHSTTPRKRPRLLWLLLCGVLACLALLTLARTSGAKKDSSPVVKTELAAAQRQKNLESFDVAWKTIRDNHFDPKLGGVNWQAVRTELRPRVEKARSMDEARAVMGEMLNRLGHT